MADQTSAKKYLSSIEAARYLGVSSSMLAKKRLSGNGPRFSKLGKRVLYDVADLDLWTSQSRRSSTSE